MLDLGDLSRAELEELAAGLQTEMARASEEMDFERAAAARDQLVEVKSRLEGASADDVMARLKAGARKGSAHATRRRWKPKG